MNQATIRTEAFCLMQPKVRREESFVCPPVMSYYINSFLSSELTCIPHFMDKYIGKYYSNTAGNALTWVFVMWNVVHLVFDEYLDILLKKMQFKSYVRKRLLKSLWYSGFYGTSFLFCVATIIRNNISILEYRKHLPLDGGPIPPHIVLGLGLFGSFFLHSCVWDLLKTGPEPSSVSYFLLTFLPLFTYITRRIELYLSLLAIISFLQFTFNFIRCLTATVSSKKQYYLRWYLFAALGLFATVHIVVVPLMFIIPLIYSLRNSGFNASLIILSIILCSWWVLEILVNPLYMYVQHWIYHAADTSKKICPGSTVDCALFGPRDDDAFNLHIIRKEMKERQDKLISKRKPKHRGVLIQTLKCMVAIKRKLAKKRNSESSESSESDSEKDKAERDSCSEDDSDSEEEISEIEDVKKREAKEYEEETARALKEDREEAGLDENEVFCFADVSECQFIGFNEADVNGVTEAHASDGTTSCVTKEDSEPVVTEQYDEKKND